jgi:uncharacterized membrane protein YbhN (UPF0104 family)
VTGRGGGSGGGWGTEAFARTVREAAARPRRWVGVGRIVMLGVAAISLYLVAPSVLAVLESWPQLSEVSPGWFLVVLAGQVLSLGCLFVMQRMALRTQAWFPVITSQLAGNAVSRIVPGGAAAGAALQLRMLAAAGVEATRAVAGLTAFSLVQVASVLALPLLALPAILAGAYVDRGLVQTAVFGGAAFVVVAALGTVMLRGDRPLAATGRAVQATRNRLRRTRPPLTGLPERLLAERDAIRAVLGARWPRVSLAVAGKLGFDFGSLLAALAAVGSQPRPSLVLVAFATALVLGMIPITPGGLGFVEAGLTGTLTLAGVPAGEAALAALVYRLASYWLPILAGLVAYGAFSWRARQPGRPAHHSSATRAPPRRPSTTRRKSP